MKRKLLIIIFFVVLIISYQFFYVAPMHKENEKLNKEVGRLSLELEDSKQKFKLLSDEELNKKIDEELGKKVYKELNEKINRLSLELKKTKRKLNLLPDEKLNKEVEPLLGGGAGDVLPPVGSRKKGPMVDEKENKDSNQ